MNEGNRILCVIALNGDGKGVATKNIRAFPGRPRVICTIIDAVNPKSISQATVSTDDRPTADVPIYELIEVSFIALTAPTHRDGN